MIRHARRGRLLAKTILPLPVTMIKPPLFTALVPPIRASPLVAPGLLAAFRAAIAMSTIAMRADEKNRVTVIPAARPLQEMRIVMGRHRRHRRLAGVDNGSPVMSG